MINYFKIFFSQNSEIISTSINTIWIPSCWYRLFYQPLHRLSPRLLIFLQTHMNFVFASQQVPGSHVHNNLKFEITSMHSFGSLVLSKFNLLKNTVVAHNLPEILSKKTKSVWFLYSFPKSSGSFFFFLIPKCFRNSTSIS